MGEGFEISKLEKVLLYTTQSVEESLVALDEGELRRRARKQILKSEYERLLATLNVQDSETISLLRSSILEAILNHKKKANELLGVIKKAKSLGGDTSLQILRFNEVISEMNELKELTDVEVAADITEFRRVSGLSFYVKPKSIDPKHYKLFIRPFPEQRVRALIMANSSQDFRLEFVLSSMEVTYNAISKDDYKTKEFPIFRSSLFDLLRRKQARFICDTALEIELQPSPTRLGMLDVKLLGVNIIDGGSKNFSILTTEQGEHTMFLDDTAQHPPVGPTTPPTAYSIVYDPNAYCKDPPTAYCNQTDTDTATLVPAACSTKDERSIIGSIDDDISIVINSLAMERAGSAEAKERTSSAEANCDSSNDTRFIDSRENSLGSDNNSDKFLENPPGRQKNTVVAVNRELSSKPEVNFQLDGGDRLNGGKQLKGGNKLNASNQLIGGNKLDGGNQLNARNQLNGGNQLNSGNQLDGGNQLNGGKKLESGDQMEIDDMLDAEVYSLLGVDCQSCPNRSCANISGYISQFEEANHSTKVNLLAALNGSLLDQIPAEMDRSIWEDSFWKPGGERFLGTSVNLCNESIWDAQPIDHTFRFGTTVMVEAAAYPCRIIAQSCTRTMKSLEYPSYMALDPTFPNILVSEPEKDRIGIYEADSFTFKSWFSVKGHRHASPRNVVFIGDRFLALLGSKNLDIFSRGEMDPSFCVYQSLRGRFSGLAEGSEGELLTTEICEGQLTIRVFRRTEVEHKFDNVSNTRVLTAESNGMEEQKGHFELKTWGSKIYITDSGRKRIYIVDSQTGKQSSAGFDGEGPGRFRSPVGLLVDDHGWVVVADNVLNKLLVFNHNGIFVKETLLLAEEKEKESEEFESEELISPCGLLRHHNTILVALKGDPAVGLEGGIRRFALELKED